MDGTASLFVSIWIKFFFLLTPFFVLTMFLALTRDMAAPDRTRTAVRVTVAVAITCLALFFFGNALFKVFGITLDAFRVGAGTLLFLSAVKLVSGDEVAPPQRDGDVSVVPLAIPITVGPATTGALLVMGAELPEAWMRATGLAALFAAIVCVGALLVLANAVERVVGRLGLNILSKLTGLVLAALAAQIVFTGVRGFLG